MWPTSRGSKSAVATDTYLLTIDVCLNAVLVIMTACSFADNLLVVSIRMSNCVCAQLPHAVKVTGSHTAAYDGDACGSFQNLIAAHRQPHLPLPMDSFYARLVAIYCFWRSPHTLFTCFFLSSCCFIFCCRQLWHTAVNEFSMVTCLLLLAAQVIRDPFCVTKNDFELSFVFQAAL